MAVNFGTYEGHRILSDAMKNSVDRVVKHHEWKKNFEEQQLNNKVLRDDREMDYLAKKREHEGNIARDNVLKQQYSGVHNNPVLSTNPDGSIVVNPAYKQIMDSWSGVSNYGNILEQNPNLRYEDIVKISSQSADFYKHKLSDIQKSFVGMTDDEKNSFMANNPGFAQMYDRLLIDVGMPRQEGQEWSNTINAGANPVETETELMNTQPGWGAEDFAEIWGDTPEWSGGIYFKGNSVEPDAKLKKNTQIVLDAMKAFKDNEKGTKWMNYYTDNMWLTANADGSFRIEEDDFGHNDIHDVKVENGKAYVRIGGSWKLLSGTTSSDWE